jgi:hypothetical protein
MHPSWNMTPWDSALTRPQQASPRKVTFGQVVPPVSQPDELHEGEKLWVNNTVDSLLSGNPEHERLHAKQMLSWIYTAAKINLNYDEYPAGSGTTTMRGAIKNNTQGLFGHTEPGIEAQKLTEAIFLLGIHHDFNGTVFDLRPDGRPQPANADPNNYQSNQAAYDQARGLFNGITKSFKIARSANSDVRSSVAFAVQQLMASPSIVNAPGGINGGHLGTQAPEQMYFSFQPDGSPLSNKTVDLLRYLNIT